MHFKDICIEYLRAMGINANSEISISNIRILYDFIVRQAKTITPIDCPSSVEQIVNNLILLSEYILHNKIDSLNKLENIDVIEKNKIQKSRLKMKNTLEKAIEVAKNSYGEIKDQPIDTNEETTNQETFKETIQTIKLEEDIEIESLRKTKKQYDLLIIRYDLLVNNVKQMLRNEDVQKALKVEDWKNIVTSLL